MPGFFTIIDYSFSTRFLPDDTGNRRPLEYRNAAFTSKTYSDSLPKFQKDKIFYQDGRYLIVLEGIVFNKDLLIENTGKESWNETVISLYEQYDKDFHKLFRGSYSGIIYDKNKNEWIVYTDPTGDKQVFYYKNKGLILFGSEINFLLSVFKLNRITISLNETAAYMLLIYGFLLGEHTLFSGIKKLNAGNLFTINNEQVVKEQYHQFSHQQNSALKENEIIEKVDQFFKKAIERQFNKDKEYGYKHLVSLSGGLDSRMVTWVAHKMGYDDMLNYTFSQLGYLDQIIAQQITNDLNHEWLFKSLEGEVFLIKQLEKVVKMSYGGAKSYDLAHGNSMLELLDFTNIGLIHTGHVGGMVLGTIRDFNIPSDESKGIDYKKPAYSLTLINRIEKEIQDYAQEFDNLENFILYTSAFNGFNQGLIIAQNYTDAFSPFLDFDFLEMCLQIPYEKRQGHNIYKKWISQKYPEAGKYVWEYIKTSIYSPSVKIRGKDRYIPELKIAALYYLNKALPFNILSTKETSYSMTPLKYWYKTNNQVKVSMDNYFKNNLDLLNKYPELKSDVAMLYQTGNGVEKNQVLTLLAAVKVFKIS